MNLRPIPLAHQLLEIISVRAAFSDWISASRALTTSPIEMTPIILFWSMTGMWRKRPSVIRSSTEIAVSSGWQPTTAAVISYGQHGLRMEGFWVRDKMKDHGLQKLIEGVELRPGWRVGVIEDVITRGSSALKAIEAVRAAGCEVVLILSLVDRLQGAEQLFREQGIPHYRSVFTIRDLGVEPDSAGQK